MKTTDIRSAFIQGKELGRDVYIRPPKESKAPKHVIWKLKHGLYGLKDVARKFNERGIDKSWVYTVQTGSIFILCS